MGCAGAGDWVQVRTMPFPDRRARILLVLLATSGLATAAAAQDHQYSSADIAIGVRVYGAQCALCHGPNGDLVNGVNLRLGRFRRAVTDDDLAQVIANGVPRRDAELRLPGQ